MKKILVLITLTVFLTLCYGEKSDQPEVHILIDVSGSMKRNDPDNFRVEAAKLFLHLTQDKFLVKVDAFATQPSNIMPLAPVTSHYQQKFKQRLYRISSDGKYTNFNSALHAADRGWQSKKRAIILLTDGKLDLGDEARTREAARELRKEMIEQLQKKGVQVYGIGLGDNLNEALLNQLADRTGGINQLVKNSDEIERSVYKIFQIIDKPQSAPIDETEDGLRTFTVDNSIHELTLIIENENNSPLILTSPDKKEYNLNHRKQGVVHIGQYQLLTIQQPLTGDWQIRGEKKVVEQVIISTDLNLVVNDIGNIFFQGQAIKLMAHLQLKDKPFYVKDIMSALKVSFQLKNDMHTETIPLKPAGHKGFIAELALDVPPGQYQLNWLAKGTGFSREIQSYAKVFPFPFLITQDKDQLLTLTMLPNSPVYEVKAQVFWGDKSFPMKKKQDYWQADLMSFCEMGETNDKPLSLQIKAFLSLEKSVHFEKPLSSFPCPVLVSEVNQVDKQAFRKQVEALPTKPLISVIDSLDWSKRTPIEKKEINYLLFLVIILLLVIATGFFWYTNNKKIKGMMQQIQGKI